MTDLAFALRVGRIKPSPSSAASQLARKLKADGRDIIGLTTGEPDFATPAHIVEAAHAAMRRGETRYTNVSGTEVLKEAIAAKFARENGLTYAPSEILVSNGAKQVIFNALMATVDKGDEVIVPTPCWVSYPDIVGLAGGTTVFAETAPEDGFALSAELLESLITPRTRWLILNSPSNPSGHVYTREALAALGAVLAQHPRVMVLTDDIYEHIIYDGRPFATIAEVCPDLRDRVLTVNGVSKSFAMTGWRLGYCGGPASLLKEMEKIQSQCTANVSSISQAAAVAALTSPKDFLTAEVASLQRRRDVIFDQIAAIDGLTCSSPQGAFYLFPDCSALIGSFTPEGKEIASDWDLVRYFLDAEGLAMVHGAAFCRSPYFRISFTVPLDVLEEGGRRLARACAALRRQ